jgi:glycosyltransferase involved in cell wall biosynthesis
MRIAVDTRGINHIFKGGVNEYTISLLQEFFTSGVEIEFDLLTSGFDASNRRSVQRLFPYPNATVRTARIPNKLLNASILALGEPKLERIGKSQSDILFMPNLNTLAKKRKTPLVVTFHDLSYEIYADFFSRRMRAWHRVVQPKRIAHEADVIIAVSESTKQDLVELYGVDSKKVRVIYPGVSNMYTPIDLNSREYRSEVALVRKKYELPNEFVLYLGTLEPRKNVGMVIEAFEAIAAKYPSLDLVIAGKKGWLCEEILTLAANSPFGTRIHFTGFVDEEDKRYLYNLAKIFVYPSFYEGFGFPVLEAMSCGIPTITSNVSSLPEVTHGNALTVSPYNVHELIWGIDQLMSDDRLYQEFVLRSLRMKSRYRWSIAMQQTKQLFEEII